MSSSTIVTIWYLLMFGDEAIEGPTPEIMTINHRFDATPWEIFTLAAAHFEAEFGKGVRVHSVELGSEWANDKE